MDHDGSSYLDVDNKLRIHTRFWSEIYSHPSSPPPSAPGWFTKTISPPTNFTYPTNLEEFSEALGPSFKAPGPSNIPFEVIKALPLEAKMVIIGKINTVLRTGAIPDIWRTAKINLLSKDLSSSNLPSTYRPISLLDTTYKTLSAILHLRLIKHVKQHQIIHPSQSGYSKGMSTANNIVTLNNILEDATDHSKEVHLLAIDLVKAYDRVQHWAIRQALVSAGLDSHTISLIMNMHKNAKAFITLDAKDGPLFDIHTGVRQGDVLAPLLFLLVINPLLTNMAEGVRGYKLNLTKTRISVLAYCDDIVFITNSRVDMERAAKLLHDYLNDFNMELNSNKSIYTSNVHSSLPILVGDKVIVFTLPNTHFKYLGVWFSATLDWSKSLSIIVNVAKARLAILTPKRIPVEAKAMVINTVILKAVEYTLNFAHLTNSQIKDLNKAISNCIKHSVPMNANTASDFVWRPTEEGGCGITEISTLMNTATLRTAFNMVLSDQSTLAYKSTLARISNHPRFGKQEDFIFSHSENRPLPSIQEPSTYINRLVNSALSVGLNIYSNHLMSSTRTISKMQDPYLLNPLDFHEECFTILQNGTLAVWTDGSHRKVKGKPKTAWGVAFSPNSSHNTWRRTNLSHNNLLAEMEAIEFALSKAPTSHNITLFTDSLSAIKIIQNNNTRSSKPEFDFKLRINHLIKERESEGSTTNLVHIFSHIQKKLSSRDTDLITRVREQMHNLDFSFGNSVPIYEGNETADKLAYLGTKTSKTNVHFPTSSKHFFLGKISHKGKIYPIADITQHTKRRQHLIWTKKKINREGLNDENLKTTHDAIKDRPDTNKIIKLQSLAVATRAQGYINLQTSSSSFKRTRQILLKYAAPTCTFCTLNVPETTTHLLGECPHWEFHRAETQKYIDELFASHGAMMEEELILRAHHDYSHVHLHRPRKSWTHKVQLLASTGRIPHSTLSSALHHLPKAQLITATSQLTNLLLDRQLELIELRHKLFQDWACGL